ncbi:hypothetical protein GCM10009613_06880 [Pseudonocardia kongjuensis]|uniref:Uncharacterized protein n=1 Tax=Pseudonocardia kongjuensis TaxID=102227 RepID=A0ABN1XHM9_9PSEU
MGSTLLKIATERARVVGVTGATGALAAVLAYRRRSVDRHRARAGCVALQAAPVDSGRDTALLYVTNHGDEPVRVTALARSIDLQATRSWRRAWLRPQVSLRLTNPVRVGRTLWPGGSDVMTAPPFGEPPALHITDSAGRQWLRSSSGALCQVDRMHVQRDGQHESWADRPVLTRPCAAA